MIKASCVAVVCAVVACLSAGAQVPDAAAQAPGTAAQAPDAERWTKLPEADLWGRLASANNLDGSGNTPFHLVMTFQLYDMAGKPTETGSVEEWWASQDSKAIIVHLAPLKEDGSAPEDASADVLRDRYLVMELIQRAVHPIPIGPKPGDKTKVKMRSFGKTQLSCFGPDEVPSAYPTWDSNSVCMAPQTYEARALLQSDGNYAAVRHSVAKYLGTYVALGLQISFFGRSAITGEVKTLQSFDPTKLKLDLLTSATGAVLTDWNTVVLEHEFTGIHNPPRSIEGAAPTYAEIPNSLNINGAVVLDAIVAKDGTVRRVVPLAYTGQVFVDAAMDSVRQWKYSPFLRKGDPIEVNTRVTVSFALPPPIN